MKDISTIQLDEFGLMEWSPFGPTKALHSKLDNVDTGENRVSFAAISNYNTDASLGNRLVRVNQPDLKKDD